MIFIWQLICAMVALAFMTAAVAIMMAVWIIVIVVGLVHPKLTPRRSCDWFLEFTRTATALVRSLAE